VAKKEALNARALRRATLYMGLVRTQKGSCDAINTELGHWPHGVMSFSFVVVLCLPSGLEVFKKAESMK
jgi:hypothetical protein